MKEPQTSQKFGQKPIYTPLPTAPGDDPHAGKDAARSQPKDKPFWSPGNGIAEGDGYGYFA